jgi:hypothetical protein
MNAEQSPSGPETPVPASAGPAEPQRRRGLGLLVAALIGLNFVVLGALGFVIQARQQTGDETEKALMLQTAALRERVGKLEAAPNPAAGLTERVTVLETGLAAVPKQPVTTATPMAGAPDQSAALNDLAKRLAALEAKPAPDAAALPALEQRIAALETSRLSQAAEMTGRIAALDKDLRETVKPALAGLAQAAPQQASKADVEAVTARLATLEAGDERKLVKSAASALAVSVLAESVRNGMPYENELTAVSRLASPQIAASPVLDTLRRQAVMGLPTQEALIASFPASAKAAREAETPRDTGMMGAIRRSLGDLVSFRLPGASTETALDTMGKALRRDDLTATLAAAQNLEPKARTAVEPWLARARLRQAGLSAIATLQAAAIRDLAATATQ